MADLLTITESQEEAHQLIKSARTKNSLAAVMGGFRTYTEKVNLNILKGDNHSFPESVKVFQYDGVLKKIQGAEGVFQMLEIGGKYNANNGFFQFLLDNLGKINHRFFHRSYK